MRYLWHDALIVTDPQAAAALMRRGDKTLDKAASTYGSVNEMCEAHGEPNLLTSHSDQTWKTVRKAVAIAFSTGNIKKKYGTILGKINELLERLRSIGPKEAVDVDQAALRVTLDVIGLAAFGQDYNAVKQDKPPRDHLLRVLPRCFTEVELRLANPLRSLQNLPRWLFKNGKKGDKSFQTFQEFTKALFNDIKNQGHPAPGDFSIAAQLMRVLGKPGITDRRILSEIAILFIAGFETTGHTVGWTLFCIATNKGVQDLVAKELDDAGLLSKPNQKPRELQYEDLKKLRYLNCCVKEAMRMYPVVSVGNGRITKSPTKIGPYTVPRNVLVGAPLYALHNAKHNWENSKEFKPERWMHVPVESFVYGGKDTDTKGKRRLIFMPFSEGERSCLGQSLAKIEVVTLLAKLLANFQFELAPEMGGVEGVIKRESTHLTLQTKGIQGIRMHLTPRDRKKI